MDTVEIEVPMQAEQLRALVDMWRLRLLDLASTRSVDSAYDTLEQCIMELEERL